MQFVKKIIIIKKKCSNDNHRPTRGSASFWPRETEPRVLTWQTNIHEKRNTAVRDLLFFLNLCRKSTIAGCIARRNRDVSSCLYVTQRIDATTMPNDGNDITKRENSRGSGFATGAESASSVAKRFCTGLNNDA